MAGTGKRMRAGMGETMEAAATGAANAHLFILFTPVLKGGYDALDAAVEAAVEAARRGRQSAWRSMSRGSELKTRWRRLMGRQRWGRRGGYDGCSGG